MKFRVGMPMWRALARAGLPLHLRVAVHYDKDSGSFWADSPDLDGLVVSGQTPEELQKEVLAAASTLLELEMSRAPRKLTADMYMGTAACAA